MEKVLNDSQEAAGQAVGMDESKVNLTLQFNSPNTKGCSAQAPGLEFLQLD